MLDNEHHQRQKDELQALQSIFSGGEIISSTVENCWKQRAPLEFRVHLEPIEPAFVSIEFAVKCTPKYPDEAPTILLSNPNGITNKDVELLKKELLDKSKELIGMEMIYELCQSTQEFLSARNKKPIESEHAEMLKMNEEKAVEEERKRADSEYHEVVEVMKENARRREEQLDRKDQKEIEQRNRMRLFDYGELEEYEKVQMLDVDPATHQPIHRRIYKIGKFEGRKNAIQRPSLHARAVECLAWDQNQHFLLTEWVFEYTLGRKAQDLTSQRQPLDSQERVSFEKSLESFVSESQSKLRSLRMDEQPFLNKYLFVHLKKNATSSTNFNCRVLVGQEYEGVGGGNCLADSQMFKYNRLVPQMASQVICCLKWLHGLNYAHGNIGPSSIWYSVGQHMFRLTDYILVSQLIKLCEQFDCLTGLNSASSIPNVPKESLLEQRRRDLFAFGIVLDSLVNQASNVVEESIENTDIRAKVNDSPSPEKLALEFIALCQSGKPAEEIAEHRYIAQDVFHLNNSITDPRNARIIPKIDESRLTKEFQITRWLGKGGFGDVYLARNKLDDNDYAVKRILLNPKNEKMNQKIMREAKLFSKLSHENIVRYYAAWIESTSTHRADTPEEIVSHKTKEAEESWIDDDLPQKPVGRLWDKSDSCEDSSFAMNDKSRVRFDESVTKLDDDSRRHSTHTLFSPKSLHLSLSAAGHSEFDVCFEEDDESDRKKDDISTHKSDPDNTLDSLLEVQQVLYIQMEYLKNSTLRTLIDAHKLFNDPPNIWRIFHEVLCGLQYIHHQNMIHRDIKPMNILLDANWTAKIGDFGLATREMMSGTHMHGTEDLDTSPSKDPVNNVRSADGGLTKDVGTALYIAPELDKGSSVSSKFYTSKIDVFSLGIVLFEMFVEPPVTLTERLIILQEFRKSGDYPTNFAHDIPQQHRNASRKLISWMTEHDPAYRPTVDTLLNSDSIPLVELEDDFQKSFLQAMNKRSNKLFKWVMTHLIHRQSIPQAINYCFDQSLCVEQNELFSRNMIVEKLKREFQTLLELYSFYPFSTHSLVPASSSTSKDTSTLQNHSVINHQTEQSNKLLNSIQQPFTVLDSSGLPLHLPIDGRQSFMRYCARNPLNYIMKRYAFCKVFSQSDISGGTHPIERLECCVDIVGSQILDELPHSASNSLFCAAEMLNLVVNIARRMSVLYDLHKWTIVLGHAHLIRAICLHLGITDKDVQTQVMNALYHISISNNKLSFDKRCDILVNRCDLGPQMAASLFRFLEPSKDFEQFREQLRPLNRSKNTEIRDVAKNAISELAGIMNILRHFTGDKYPNLLFDPGMTYRPQTFNTGLVFLLNVELLFSNKSVPKSVVILAGGSYGNRIAAEKHAQDPDPPLFAYGFNLPLDNMAQIHQLIFSEKDNEFLDIENLNNSGVINITNCLALVCTSSEELVKDKCSLARDLWELNIGTDIFHEPIGSINVPLEICQQNGIHFLLVIIDKDEVVIYRKEPSSFAKRTLLIGGYSPQPRVSSSEAIRIIVEHLSDVTKAPLTSIQQGSIISSADENQSQQLTSIHRSVTFSSVSINYPPEDRPAHNMKKRIEMQLRACLGDFVVKLLPKTKVEVFVTSIQQELVRSVAATVDRGFTQLELSKAFDVLLRQAGRQKPELDQLHRQMQPFFNKGQAPTTLPSEHPILVIWSKSSENFYRVIA